LALVIVVISRKASQERVFRGIRWQSQPALKYHDSAFKSWLVASHQEFAMLPCQLLCASAASYDIVNAGTLSLANAYVQKAGFTQAPTTLVGGDGTPKINACLVGTAGNAVVVAFRGTLSSFSGNVAKDWSTFLDWLQDFLAEPVAVNGLPGKVHDGFQKAFFSLWQNAAAEIQAQMTALGAAAELYVTGHSKGGPLARYAAWSLTQAPFHLRPTCTTFAAPRPGDQEFANAYSQNSDITDARYEYQDDFVPHVPPTLDLIRAIRAIPNLPDRVEKVLNQVADWSYVPVGTLEFIDWSNKIVSPTGWLDKAKLNLERILSLAKLTADCQFKEIGEDHRLEGGYCNGVCPAGTCS
jgi:hypothetical protein